ncbi:MAG: hypothetical protein EXR29_15595 [Betaproteobacteria bacterium]|nr:hypothetical protein [Betaproteobacteria bacterium]
MSNTDIFIVPEAPVRQQAPVTVTRKAPAGPIRLGILDNSKGNADHLLGLLIEGSRAAFPIGALTSLRKPNAAAAADSRLLDQLAAEADLVVSAMAD